MGQSSSTDNHHRPTELQQLESLAATTGALSSLQKSFSRLSDPQTRSIPISRLQKCFELTFEVAEDDQGHVIKELRQLFSNLGSAIVDLFFSPDEHGVNWSAFLKGYTNCCAGTAASSSFINLFRMYTLSYSHAGIPLDLKFESCDEDCKIIGSLSPRNVLFLLWICWVLFWDSRTSNLTTEKEKRVCSLPDVSHLVHSAIESCVDGDQKLDFWDSAVAEMNLMLPAAKVHAWSLYALPRLADCFSQFFQGRLCCVSANEATEAEQNSSSPQLMTPAVCGAALLSPGRAWSVSLTLRGPVHEELSKYCVARNLDEMIENLLYRSTVHGKGLNRFWANVDGYNGPMLLLISASEDKSNKQRWIIGALTNQGFQNKDSFYGTSGCLFALSPVFHVLSSSGKERNFVYSHLHPTGRLYEPHPKPVGVAFGGSIGNERVFLNEDFDAITIRHHVVDKTYRHGALFPNQGLLSTEAHVVEVEAWGLGGRKAQEVQDLYRKREQLFAEQRRKVDLRTFANWEESPEKIMMDMMSDPNAAKRS